jgi:hypothetical protein
MLGEAVPGNGGREPDINVVDAFRIRLAAAYPLDLAAKS